MKRLLTTLALAAVCTSAMAQYNSRVQMFAGYFNPSKGYHMPGNKRIAVNYIGASFEHRIYKNLGLKVQHMRWINTQGGMVNDYSVWNDDGFSTKTGTVLSRNDYQALELAQTYTLRKGRHDVYIAAGPSVTWGWVNMVGNNKPDASQPNKDVNIIEVPQTKAGIVAELGYNARILGPVSIGASAIYRHYEFFQCYAAQLNIGYNFNSINLHR